MRMSDNQSSRPQWSSQSEWHVTRQWGPIAIRYCRHSCHFATGELQWNFKDEHTLGLLLSPRPFRFSHRQDSYIHAGHYSKGDVLIAPANTTWRTRADGDVQIMQLRIADSFVRTVSEEALDRDGDLFDLLPNLQTRDPEIEAIAMMLLTELHRESCSSQLYVDSLANVLAIHLLREHGTACPQLPVYDGGLSQRQLMQVLDYIDAHLDREIKLADLAQLVDMSHFHFGRLFKRSLGLSPYQYLLQQRVERAKQWLKRTNKPIVEIAFDCGFNSHSHLCKQFRQQTGITPKAYRAT